MNIDFTWLRLSRFSKNIPRWRLAISLKCGHPLLCCIVSTYFVTNNIFPTITRHLVVVEWVKRCVCAGTTKLPFRFNRLHRNGCGRLAKRRKRESWLSSVFIMALWFFSSSSSQVGGLTGRFCAMSRRIRTHGNTAWPVGRLDGDWRARGCRGKCVRGAHRKPPSWPAMSWADSRCRNVSKLQADPTRTGVNPATRFNWFLRCRTAEWIDCPQRPKQQVVSEYSNIDKHTKCWHVVTVWPLWRIRKHLTARYQHFAVLLCFASITNESVDLGTGESGRCNRRGCISVPAWSMRKNSLAETQMALITSGMFSSMLSNVENVALKSFRLLPSDKEFKERLIKTVKKEVSLSLFENFIFLVFVRWASGQS